MEKREIHVLQCSSAVVEKLVTVLQQLSDQILSKHDMFLVGISGGSMIFFLAEALPKVSTMYHKWKIFLNDERLVPEDTEDSTFGACRRILIESVEGLTEESFVRINYNLCEPQQVADDYSVQLSKYCPGNPPKFDILLLGLGEDGHTCSLFPGHPLLKETESLVGAVTDSPKPPPNRITFTLPVLKNAANVIFLVTGEAKSEAVKGVLVDKDETLPATLVKLNDGNLIWILDKAAAKLLPPDFYK